MLLLEEPPVKPVDVIPQPPSRLAGGCSLAQFLQQLGNRLPVADPPPPPPPVDCSVVTIRDAHPREIATVVATTVEAVVYELEPNGLLIGLQTPDEVRPVPSLQDDESVVSMIDRHEQEAVAWILASGTASVACGWCGRAHAANLIRPSGGCGPKRRQPPEETPAQHDGSEPDRPFLLDWPTSRPIHRNRHEEEAGWQELAEWTRKLTDECGGIDEHAD